MKIGYSYVMLDVAHHIDNGSHACVAVVTPFAVHRFHWLEALLLGSVMTPLSLAWKFWFFTAVSGSLAGYGDQEALIRIRTLTFRLSLLPAAR